MATLQIEFRNGKFASNNGVNVEVANETHIEGNGWVGDIGENQEISFVSTENCCGVQHQIKLRIKNGVVKQLLKIGNGRPRVLRIDKIDKWPVDGIITLSDGILEKRNCYFMVDPLQDFLNDYNITSVLSESANGIYILMAEHNGHCLVSNEVIETDGMSKVIPTDTETDEYSKTGEFTIRHMIEITHASWVIKNIYKYGELKYRILYTLDNPQKIVGLPRQ